MAISRVSVGRAGDESSATVLKHRITRAGGRPIRIRITFSCYAPGDRKYWGLRDHTIRFKVNDRREFELFHKELVDLGDKILPSFAPDEEDVNGTELEAGEATEGVDNLPDDAAPVDE